MELDGGGESQGDSEMSDSDILLIDIRKRGFCPCGDPLHGGQRHTFHEAIRCRNISWDDVGCFGVDRQALAGFCKPNTRQLMAYANIPLQTAVIRHIEPLCALGRAWGESR